MEWLGGLGRGDFGFPPPSRPLRVVGGLQAKSRRGEIGTSWWSRRFIAVLEHLLEKGRLARGRSYARTGQVMQLDIHPGVVSAVVQGSRPTPYQVRVAFAVLSEKDWQRAEKAMAEEALFLARLLNSEMPTEIEEVFAGCKLSLFPATRRDLKSTCSCPDSYNPCKHIAAVYYLLGEAFDDDPFLIFAWRGRPRERLLQELRALRGRSIDGVGEEARAAGMAGTGWIPDIADEPALGSQLDRFWDAGPGLPGLRAEPRVPEVPDALLRELEPGTLAIFSGTIFRTCFARRTGQSRKRRPVARLASSCRTRTRLPTQSAAPRSSGPVQLPNPRVPPLPAPLPCRSVPPNLSAAPSPQKLPQRAPTVSPRPTSTSSSRRRPLIVTVRPSRQLVFSLRSKFTSGYRSGSRSSAESLHRQL